MYQRWKSKVLRNTNRLADLQRQQNAAQHEHLLGDEELLAEEDDEYPIPTYFYWIYFSYGVTMLLPWNVFITASDYFSERFAGSAYEETFQHYFSAYFNCSNLICLAILLWIKHKQINSKLLEIAVPLSINMLIFVYLAVSALFLTDTEPVSYFRIVIICMVMTGLTTSILQACVFAETSRIPAKYTQAVMSGQGLAGVIVALFSLLTTITLKAQHLSTIAIFYYFFIALCITLLATLGRLALKRHPLYRRLLNPSFIPSAVSEINPYVNTNALFSSSDLRDESEEMMLEESGIAEGSSTYFDENEGLLWSIITKKSTLFLCTIVYIYFITLSLFPSITVLITPVNSFNEPSTFTAVHFLLFNLGDWFGRSLPIYSFFQVQSSNGKLLFRLAFARTLFIPLFLGCVKHNTVLTNSDMLYFMYLFLFAVSNGWLTSLVFMIAPKQSNLSSAAERSMVGSALSFFLVIGLALGGLFSFLLQ